VVDLNIRFYHFTRFARVTGNPERLLGFHFFGPVSFMGLVEVVKGKQTSVEIFGGASGLSSRWGKNLRRGFTGIQNKANEYRGTVNKPSQNWKKTGKDGFIGCCRLKNQKTLCRPWKSPQRCLRGF